MRTCHVAALVALAMALAFLPLDGPYRGILVGAALAIVSLTLWPKQIIPGSEAQTQIKGKQALDDARARLEQATAHEKFNPTKQSALAVDEALQQYNEAMLSLIEPAVAPLPETTSELEPNNTPGTAN